MNIMIVGVGGQGTLLASRILGKVAIKEGYDVKVSEVSWYEPARRQCCYICKVQ